MNIFEDLSPAEANACELLEKLALHLEKTEKLLERKLQNLKKAPAGKLRAATSHNSAQYFLVTDSHHKNGTYIPKTRNSLAKALAQKEYDIKLVKTLTRQIKILSSTITKLKQNIPAKTIQKIPAIKASLITPVSFPDQEYASFWKSEPYPRKPFHDDTPEFYTALGERVRSKSEILIADTLQRLGIPYRYEFPLKINSGTETMFFHPDFLCLNLKTRKTFYWEHFGLMSNSEYAEKCAEKLILYERNGIVPGHNLIFTMETEKSPLNTKTVEKLAKRWLT